VLLRPALPSDIEHIFVWATTKGAGDRWRYHGRTPTMEDFVDDFWRGVHEQDVIVSASSGERLGLVTAYNADMRSRHCYLALLTSPRYIGRGLAVEGAAVFAIQLVQAWPFRKLYVEAYDYNRGLVRSLGRRFTQEARLEDDLFWEGEWHTRYIFSIDAYSLVNRYAGLLGLQATNSSTPPPGQSYPSGSKL
jgi:RimJ/RimL family protein N-acetyltransferase